MMAVFSHFTGRLVVVLCSWSRTAASHRVNLEVASSVRPALASSHATAASDRFPLRGLRVGSGGGLAVDAMRSRTQSQRPAGKLPPPLVVLMTGSVSLLMPTSPVAAQGMHGATFSSHRTAPLRYSVPRLHDQDVHALCSLGTGS